MIFAFSLCPGGGGLVHQKIVQGLARAKIVRLGID